MQHYRYVVTRATIYMHVLVNPPPPPGGRGRGLSS